MELFIFRIIIQKSTTLPPRIQYKIFKSGDQVVGVALWAYLSEEAEKRLIEGKLIQPQDWGKNAQLDPAEGLVRLEGGTPWLIKTLAPYNSAKEVVEEILQDLKETEFKEDKPNYFKINYESKTREVVEL
jgi:hemolysin-activating ACP:hemolysin acyltransferase